MLNIYIANINTLPTKNNDLLMNILSAQRQEKIKTITNPQNRRLTLAAGLLLNYSLTRQNISPNNLSLTCNAYGKPFFEDNSVHFNLSHSGQYVLCAISDIEVGADIQKMTAHYNLNVAKRFFHSDEYTYLADLPTDKQQHVFFRLWTLKESYVKNIGTGIANTFNKFSIQITDNIPYIMHNNKKQLYLFHEYKINNYYAAICSNAINDKVSLQWLDLGKAL